MNIDWFILFRNIAFTFATLMLVKYLIFLVIAPFYSAKEKLRKLRVKSKGVYGNYFPLVSVVIPAWNEEVGIKKSIFSIINNTYKNVEVIVVNDGSSDRTGEIVENLISRFSLGQVKLRYYYKENGGKGSALNYGINQAKGEIIITMDADSAFSEKAIENITQYFQDDELQAVVGNVKVANRKSIIGLLQRLEYLFGFYYKRTHAVLGAEYIFGGACAAFRKSVFEKVGLFDTKNKTEDIEMSMRIRYSGMKCAYGEDVICYTEGASTLRGLINQRLRWKKGRFDTFIKYRRLFFSFDRKHNFFLSWFVLPFSLLSEIQLFFEPIAITLLLSYSFISGDYLSVAIGAMFVFVIYFVNALFGHKKFDLETLFLFPFTWLLFYILVWVEYLSLLRSIKMILRGDDIEWQKWDRKGLDNV